MDRWYNEVNLKEETKSFNIEETKGEYSNGQVRIVNNREAIVYMAALPSPKAIIMSDRTACRLEVMKILREDGPMYT